MKQKKFGKEQYDNLEKVIKSLITVGEVFKDKKTLYEKIGLDNLGLSNLSGGDQKKKAWERISMCMRIEFVEEGKHPVFCAEIYESHKYIEKPNGRGKNGVYIDRTVPILISELPITGTIHTTRKQLIELMGMIKKCSYDDVKEELLKINNKITRAMYNQFDSRVKSITESVVYNTLNRIQKDYKFLKYKRKHKIRFNSGKTKLSNNMEIKIIEKAEKQILKEYDFESKFVIYRKGLKNEYYKKVVELINEIYDYDWSEYRNVIEIKLDTKLLLNEKLKLQRMDIENLKCELRDVFRESLINKTEKEYEKTNKDADIKTDEWINDDNNRVEDIVNDDELVSLYKAGTLNKRDLLIGYAPDIFKYRSNYLEVQGDIIYYFVKEPDEVKKMDLEWLNILDEAV